MAKKLTEAEKICSGVEDSMAKKLTEAEKICSGVAEKYRAQAVTLADAVLCMQRKIKELRPLYEEAEATVKIYKTNGTEEEKINPILVEFRTLTKEYANALKSLQGLIDSNSSEEKISSLDDLRKGLRLCQ